MAHAFYGFSDLPPDPTDRFLSATGCLLAQSVVLPGKDQTLGTADDQTTTLSQYRREISIRNVSNENGELRSITVTVTYQNGPTKRTYTLTTFISAYS